MLQEANIPDAHQIQFSEFREFLRSDSRHNTAAEVQSPYPKFLDIATKPFSKSASLPKITEDEFEDMPLPGFAGHKSAMPNL